MAPLQHGSPLALTVLALLYCKPMHPYGIQRVIKQWGKDLVVNVRERTGVYRTVERLRANGLVTVKETERDQAYPERTVYELTAAGRTAARDLLLHMLSTPKQEYPRFPAALSHVPMLTPAALAEALSERHRHVSAALAELDERITALTADGLPRIGLIEFEYLRAVTAAEAAWLESVVGELRAGALDWTWEAFAPFDPVGE